ncbi:SsgA family sporulation/cell division regulator [Catenulispora pinisilvae]|uniref:SsgA family sporulation/cell division regulator n=1 Tax=Catenulispora pinisilvae TaxID=2705253 RepID=UPI00189156A9|nr:SsgA family sporulation/cell division regulator [Catenulispora pinisilvae]
MLATHEQPLKTHVVTSDTRMAGVPAVLRYRSDDPFAVRLAFLDVDPDGGADAEEGEADGPGAVTDAIEWVFARDLLTDGLHTPTGEGDVHVWPFGPSDLMIELRSGASTALVITPQAAVRMFLCHAYAIVPAGSEPRHLDLDRALARLVDHGQG